MTTDKTFGALDSPAGAGSGRAVPDHVGKYRIDGVIGRGAVGIVYKGYDEQIDRPLAIKTLRLDVIEHVADRDNLLKRFAAEARSAGRCIHPNIVTVFDYVEQDDAPYIVMEFVEAGTLENVIDSGHLLPLRQVGEIMAQLLFALDHAHSKGVIHRDVKPANILCPSATSIKVTDFGVARFDSMGLTNPSGLGAIGTPNYMSPEQFLGRPVDGRADLFSAGVILFQLLAGAKPFVASDIAELMRKLLSETAPSLSTLRPGRWLHLDAVVQKALARNPDDRFSNADEFIDALNNAIEATGSDNSPPLDLTKISLREVDDATGTSASQSRGTGDLSQTMAAKLMPSTLSAVEAALARSIGPIARVVLRNVAQKATDPDMLLTELTNQIPVEAEAQRFRAEAEHTIRADHGVAAVLAKRVAQKAIGHEDYFRRLSEAIPNENQRSQFVADMQHYLARAQA